MPFPLQAQSAARATESGGGRAGDVGRVGQGGAENAGWGPASSRENVDRLSWVSAFEILAEGEGASTPATSNAWRALSPESSYLNFRSRAAGRSE